MPRRTGDDGQSLMDEKRYTIGAFGMLTWDQFLQVEQFPDPGTFSVAQQTIEQSGGTTGNMSVALRRLGVDVSIASRVGDDPRGQSLLSELIDEGCDVDHVHVVQDTPTDHGVILVSGSGDQMDRTIFWIKGARLKHGHHLPIEEFFARDLVIVDIDDPRLRLLLLDLPMHVSPRTRIFGTMTFLAELPPAQALELAYRHDYLVGNVSELVYATECDDRWTAFERFQREMVLSQVRFAFFTDSSNGCYILTRDLVQNVPAFEIEPVDPTGAGDAFAAGAAFGILNRWELPEIANFANAMGALATRQLGARSALPSLDETRDFIASTPKRSAGDKDTATT
jgi:sugar/nucleoside kinase (ribokinase family)